MPVLRDGRKVAYAPVAKDPISSSVRDNTAHVERRSAWTVGPKEEPQRREYIERYAAGPFRTPLRAEIAAGSLADRVKANQGRRNFRSQGYT